jgi:hypothetical protein
MHKYAHTHTHTHTHIYIYSQAHIHTHTHTYIHTQIQEHTINGEHADVEVQLIFAAKEPSGRLLAISLLYMSHALQPTASVAATSPSLEQTFAKSTDIRPSTDKLIENLRSVLGASETQNQNSNMQLDISEVCVCV